MSSIYEFYKKKKEIFERKKQKTKGMRISCSQIGFWWLNLFSNKNSTKKKFFLSYMFTKSKIQFLMSLLKLLIIKF